MKLRRTEGPKQELTAESNTLASGRHSGLSGTPNLKEIPSDSPWRATGRRFLRHRLAVASSFLLAMLYLVAFFGEFIAPYAAEHQSTDRLYCPPQLPRYSFDRGWNVSNVQMHRDPVTFRAYYVEAHGASVPLGFFVRGDPYRFWGLFSWDRHLFGVDLTKMGRSSVAQSAPSFYFLGADKFGRDIFSRLIFGARISLSIGLVSILISLVLGVSIGGISGYLGGGVDVVAQRLIEILNSIPQLPLWLALAAVLPANASPLFVYFAITVVLGFIGWAELARIVRGRILALREEEFVVAARLIGASPTRVLVRHLLPGLTSQLLVVLTMSVPGMILGETSLSFLGLGLRSPVVSWGVMLQDTMSIQSVANYPWLFTPAFFIVLTVLCFNFLGDGLRDTADRQTYYWPVK